MSSEGLQVGIFLAGGLLLMLLGVVIFRENPGRRLNRITAAMLFFAGLGSLLAAIGSNLAEIYAADPTEAAEGGSTFTRLTELAVLWEFFFPTLVYFSLTFPRESNTLRKHPRLVWLLYFPYLFHLLIVVLKLGWDPLESINIGQAPGVLNLFAVVVKLAIDLLSQLFDLVYRGHLKLWAVVNVFYVIAAMFFLSRARRETSSRRLALQVSIVQIGVGLSIGLYILVNAIPLLLNLLPPEWLTAFFNLLSLAIGCGTIAWVIIRHQFLDVQVLAKRSLIYSAATGVVVGVYFLLFTWFQGIYQELAPANSNTSIVQIIFVATAVLTFQPLLARMESIVDRFFIRDQTDYRNVLQQSVRNLIGILDMDSLVRAVYQTIERAFLVERAAVVLLDRTTGTFRYVRRGPPPLKQGQWEVKTPEAFEQEEGFDEQEGDGVVDTFRLTRRGPGKVVFRIGDPVSDALLRASGPVRYELLVADLPEDENEKSSPLEGLTPYLVVPLKQRNTLVGIITLGAKLADTGFNSEELTLLAVLGSQIAESGLSRSG
jgi:hypothetical protein